MVSWHSTNMPLIMLFLVIKSISKVGYIYTSKSCAWKTGYITNSYWNSCCNLKLHTVYCKLAIWSHLNHSQTTELNSKTWCLASLKAQHTYANITSIFESQYLRNGLMKIPRYTVFPVYCPVLATCVVCMYVCMCVCVFVCVSVCVSVCVLVLHW